MPCFWSGFTLLELLVVVAVAGILGSLLLPGYSGARRKAQSAVCLSNLRQLGLGLQNYLDTASGAFPYAESFPADNPKGASFWFDALATGLPNASWGEGVFKCPVYPGVAFGGGAEVNQGNVLVAVYAPCGSYAYNAIGRRSDAADASSLPCPGLAFGHTAGQPVRERDVVSPANFYALGDAPLVTAPWGKVAAPRLGGASNYNALAGDNAEIRQTQHPAIFNMLCADGHSESVRVRILLSTNAVHRSRWNRDNLP